MFILKVWDKRWQENINIFICVPDLIHTSYTHLVIQLRTAHTTACSAVPRVNANSSYRMSLKPFIYIRKQSHHMTSVVVNHTKLILTVAMFHPREIWMMLSCGSMNAWGKNPKNIFSSSVYPALAVASTRLHKGRREKELS